MLHKYPSDYKVIFVGDATMSPYEITYAGGSVLGDSVTSEYKINYLRPALGERLTARATVLSSGQKQAVCQCEVIALNNGEERLVAVAQGTISKVDTKN